MPHGPMKQLVVELDFFFIGCCDVSCESSLHAKAFAILKSFGDLLCKKLEVG